MRKIKLSNWAKENDMQYLAAWRMAINNQIPTEKLPTGQIRVLVEDEKKPIQEKVVSFC